MFVCCSCFDLEPRVPISSGVVMDKFVDPNADLSGVKLPDEYADFTRECKAFLKEGPQVPVCKTVYKRVAFQNPDVNGIPDSSVRISIDFDLEVYEIDSYTPSTETDLGFSARFKTGRVVTLPFAIMEVKLQRLRSKDPPKWIRRLHERPEVMWVQHFSKYIHGMYTLHRNDPKLALESPKWLKPNSLDYDMKKLRHLHKVKNAKEERKRLRAKKKKLLQKLARLNKKEQRVLRILGKDTFQLVGDSKLSSKSSDTRLLEMIPASAVVNEADLA